MHSGRFHYHGWLSLNILIHYAVVCNISNTCTLNVQTCVTHFVINLLLRGFYLQQYSSYEFYYFVILILLYFTFNTYLLHFQYLFQYPLYFERLYSLYLNFMEGLKKTMKALIKMYLVFG
jgi:hypothetical protein